MLQTKQFLLAQSHQIRTAPVNSTPAFAPLLLLVVEALQYAQVFPLQKEESDINLLQCYLHFHQKDTLLQYLVFRQVLQVYHDFGKLFLNDILFAHDSLELFYQVL